jgi:hypothetical protein
MKRVERFGLTTALMATVIAVACFATPVFAQDAFTRGRTSLELTMGFGFAVQGDARTNPYNVSLGATAGYTLTNGLYLGAMANYFTGDSEVVAGSTFSQQLELTTDWSHMALDVGYDLAANEIVLRPTVAVGAAILGSCFDSECESDTYLLIAPGLSAIGPLGKHSFFSFTLRYSLVPGSKKHDPADGVSFGVGFGAAL